MRRSSKLAMAAVLVWSSSAHATEYFNDPLTAASFPGRGSMGGTFSSNGWTVVNESDSVWYEIQDALVSGRVEYTITGLSLATSLKGSDHDIFTMYQDPGVPEPVAYSPYFRNNDFKIFTRIFGAKETQRPGAMKLEAAFCPRGAPWYHDGACPAGCDGSGIAYANGNQNDVGWDANTSYRMAVEWGGGKITFYRDQKALGTVTYPGVFAPQPLRVRLSSPRHDGVYPGDAYMPLGATLRDVLIQGTAGNMTPVCGSTAPDAGPSTDAGPPPADAGSQSQDWEALADVTAANWETGVFPDVTDLNVEATTAGEPTAVVYLRFPAVTGVVTKAILRMTTSSSPSAAGGSGVVCPVSDDTWSENTLTWATHPAWGTTCAGVASSVDPNQEIQWDVTSLVQSGKSIDLAIVSQDANGAHYLSKEAGDPTKSPHLLVQTTAATDAGSGGSPGSGGLGNGGTIEGGVGASGGSDASRGGTAADDGGCGCRTAPRSRAPLAWLAGLLLIAARRRRTPRLRRL